jgi:hypothetical protein
MIKKPETVNIAIHKQDSLASRAIARLEAAAASINESEATRRDRTLQLISTKDRPFSALIRHGRTTIQIEGDDFAVSTE